MPKKRADRERPIPPEIRDWDTGFSLWGACSEFCEPSLWAEYEAAWGTAFPTLPPEDLPPLPPPAQIRIGPLPFDPGEFWQRAMTLDEQMKASIVTMLRGAKLLALGYLSPRRQKQTPIRIPAELWNNGRISWAKSQLWAETATFEEVRCIPSRELQAATVLASIPIPARMRNPGRPSRRDDIISAYRLLRDQNKIDFTSLERNYANVRRVASTFSEPITENGLGDEAIRLAVREEFFDDQKRTSSD